MRMADLGIGPENTVPGRNVYLLEDHELVRRGLRRLLESKGFTIVGETGSAREAARRIPALRPDLVILDDDLPDGSGAGVCRNVVAADPSIGCLVLTGEAAEGVLIDAILAGAWGCLSKQDSNSEQLRLIHRALAGHTAFSRRFQDAVLAPFPGHGPGHPGGRLLCLSRQERRVVIGLGKGLTNRQIGQEMSLAEMTVKNLVSSVLMKLGLTRRTEAAILITQVLNQSKNLAYGSYRFSVFPDTAAEVTAALLDCLREDGRMLPSERTGAAGRLATALASARAGMTSSGGADRPSTP